MKCNTSTSSVEIQLPRKEKRFHVTGDENSCVLGDHHDEWLDKLTTWMTSWNTRTMDDADRRKVPGHVHHIGLFYIKAAFPHYELLNFTCTFHHPWHCLLSKRALYGTRKASKVWASTSSKALQIDGRSQSRVLYYDAADVATTTCFGDDIITEASAQSQTKIDATMRNHFETKRLAIIGALAKTTKASFSNARFAGMDTNAVSCGLLIQHKPSEK